MTETAAVDELDRIHRHRHRRPRRAGVGSGVPARLVDHSSSIISNQVVERDEDDPSLSGVRDARFGDLRIRTVTLDEPRYAAFRWLDSDVGEDERSTLVEFRIEDR